MIKIAVVGSRNFCDYSFFAEKLEQIISNLDGEIEFVSGGCKSGADNMIAIYCKTNGFKITEYLPDWNGISKGTKNSIDLYNKQNKPIRIIKI